ncbi:MAG: EamA family transporter [Nanoarchaeota archaeon]|nr:EamA family transporter [Nanoarchaeota archaeon]
MQLQKKPFILVLICSLLVAIAQIFLKEGADTIIFTPTGILSNFYLILGIVFYAAGTVLLLKALKYGNLTTLYPFIALSYVWVTLLAYIFLNEPITSLHWLGVGSIVLGISSIGAGTQ